MNEKSAVVEPQDEVEELLEGDQDQTDQSTETAQEENAAEEKAEGEETEEKADDSEEKKEDEEKKARGRKSLDERLKEISRKTWEMREQERQLKAERERLEEVKKTGSKLEEPKIDNYDDHDKYVEDMRKYATTLAEMKAEEKAAEMARTARQNQSEEKKFQKWHYEREKELEKNPDFDRDANTVRRVLDIYNATHIAAAIIESDDGVGLVKYLAKNLDAAEELAQQPEIKGLMGLGKIASKLNQKPAKKKVSSAPPPVGKDKGGGGANSNWAKMSQAEYNRRRNQMA